jgi:hypothetical protein
MPSQPLHRVGVYRHELKRKSTVGRHYLLRRQRAADPVFIHPGELKTKSAFIQHCLSRRQLEVQQVFSDPGELKTKGPFRYGVPRQV